MSIEVKVYDNGDHTCLVWLPTDGKSIATCRGFTIHKLLNGKESYLHGSVGFSDNDKLDPKNAWKFPLQRFLWWDYFVKPGDKVRYSVIPVVGPDRPPYTGHEECESGDSRNNNHWPAHASHFGLLQ